MSQAAAEVCISGPSGSGRIQTMCRVTTICSHGCFHVLKGTSPLVVSQRRKGLLPLAWVPLNSRAPMTGGPRGSNPISRRDSIRIQFEVKDGLLVVRPYVERLLRVQRFAATLGTRETVLPYIRPLCASSKDTGLDEVRGASSQTACRTLRCVGINGLSRVGISSRWFIVVIGTLAPLSARCGRRPGNSLKSVSPFRQQPGSFRSLLLVCGNTCFWAASRR